MATLAGNGGFKILYRLQFGGLLLPWVSKKNAILCVKGRDYGSSFPVRYVPKKSVKIKESENFEPVNTLERNEPLKWSDASELRIELSDGGRGVKKSVKINESENFVPVNGLERNELRKRSDASELRIEASQSGRGVKKSVNINESQNFVPANVLERNEPHKWSDASELRIEVSDSGRVVEKSVKVNESETSVPVNGLKRNELHRWSDASELRIEVSNSERGVQKSVKSNKSEDSVSVKRLERNEVRKCSDAGKLRIEVSNSGRDVKKSIEISESENDVPVNHWERNEVHKRSDESELRTEVSISGRGLKKSVKINESENSVRVKGLERNELHKQSDASELRIEVSNGNSGRGVKRSIASDKKFHNNSLLLHDPKQEFGEETNNNHGIVQESELFEEPAEVLEEVKIHQVNDNFDHNLQLGKTMQDAENLAIKLLATRAFTAVEMRKKLNGKKFPPHVIECVITDFQSRGLLNDSLYAESFSRARWSSASWGPRRIKQALFNKGISQIDANKAVNLVFKDGESDEDQESKLGMSKHSVDHLFVQASKQWLRSQDAPKETRKIRIIRWLQYRGFNWGVTSFILKKLEFQYPS